MLTRNCDAPFVTKVTLGDKPDLPRNVFSWIGNFAHLYCFGSTINIKGPRRQTRGARMEKIVFRILILDFIILRITKLLNLFPVRVPLNSKKI